MSEKTPLAVVNDLVELCRDAEKGFGEAAKEVREQRIRELFMTQSQQMGQFGKSLEEQVVRLGGTPRKGGTVAGTLHRTWMDIRAVLNHHDAKLMILECERGAGAILDHYQHALNQPLPQEVKDIVEKQFVEIVVAKNRLRDMEHPGEKEGKKKYNPLQIE